ncbi:MAG: glycosyltransferase family 2 protein [Acidimicrobiales bacterium]
MIPVRDGDPDLLAIALRSVLGQGIGPTEMQIEVVDDGSQRLDVATVVAAVGGERVAVRSREGTHGAPRAFSECVERARGRWVHILHADDLVYPGFYAAYDEVLAADPEAVMAVSQSWFVDGDGHQLGLSGPLPTHGGRLIDAERLITRDNPVNFAAVVVRRSAYERVGGFDPGLIHANDWEMWTRLAAAGPVAVVPVVLAGYRRHRASDTSRLRRSMVYLTDPVAALDLITDRFPDRADGRRVRREVRGRLACEALVAAAEQTDDGLHRLGARSALAAAGLSWDRVTARAAAVQLVHVARHRLGSQPHHLSGTS